MTIGLIETIRSRTDVDLCDPEFKGIVKLEADPVLLARVIWLACEKEATARNIVADDFFDLFDGDAFEAAQRALVESLVNFTQPRRRSILRAYLATTEEAEKRAINRVEKILNDPDLIEKIETAAEMSIRKKLETSNILSNSLGDSPESSASIRET